LKGSINASVKGYEKEFVEFEELQESKEREPESSS
jgi:hypothetical protein